MSRDDRGLSRPNMDCMRCGRVIECISVGIRISGVLVAIMDEPLEVF